MSLNYAKIPHLADVAEWLRRLTRNQFPSWSVGSNPTICVMTVLKILGFLRLSNSDPIHSSIAYLIYLDVAGVRSKRLLVYHLL